MSTSETTQPSLKEGEFVGALDCGTTSTRFIIFDQYANIIAQKQEEFPQYYPHPGWHEHDALELQAVADSVIAGAIAELESPEIGYSKESIKVIGITNQRETTVAWSRKTGKPLCKAIVWDDGRTAGVVKHFEKKLEEDGFEDEDGNVHKGEDGVKLLKQITGLQLSTYFSAIKLVWMIDHHDQVRRAHDEDDLLFGTVESWIVYNLTGGSLHITDPTNASRTLLLNLQTLKWSTPMLRFFDLKPSILPKLVSSSETFSTIQTSSKNHPLEGMKIGGLVGDQQGALVGNKCLGKGEAKCTYGTGAFLLFCTGDEVVVDEDGLIGTVAFQSGREGKPVYALEGSISVAGSAIKWLRDSLKLIQSAQEVNELASQALSQNRTSEGGDNGGGTGEDEEGSGLYFVTAFSGLLAPYWDPGAAGMLIGLSSYTTPGHIALATLEAAAFQTRAILECVVNKEGFDLKHLKVDGGMTNGDVAMQVLSDIGGFDVIRSKMRESTALGSAILAGSSINLFGWDMNKPETLKDVNTKGEEVFRPRMSDAERKRRWKGWQRAVERSKGWNDIS